jgi:hypothetical protein
MAVNVNGGALEFDAVINASQFNAAISSIERQLAGLTKTAEQQANAIDGLVRKTTTAIAGYASFITSGAFVADIVRVRGEFQQLEIAFTTMLGSKADADKLMAEVTQFAATTPFELQQVAGATKQLLAFGIESDKVIDTLRQLGDVSAGLGQPIGEIAYLFGTIKTQGTALTQDIRQFAQRGIPIYEELAKVLGVSVEQVGEFISAGKVGFPEVEAVFKNLTAEGSRFGGLMEAQSKSLTGQLSNLRDAWNQMLNDIGKGQEGLFSDIIQGATFMVKNFDEVIKILKILVITYGTYKAAIIATTIAQSFATAATKGYTIAETLRFQAMLLSERAMKLLNATMLKNPAVAVATGIAALVSALLIFGKRATEAKSASQLLANAQEKVADKMAEATAKIRPYQEELKKANLSEADRVRIYNELLKIDPKIVDGLTAKTLSYQTLTNSVNLYLTALRKQLSVEANKDALQESLREEMRLQKEIDQITKDKQRGKGTPVEYFKQVELENTQKALEQQKKTSEELAGSQIEDEKKVKDAKGRTLQVIDDEIKALKEQQNQSSTTAKQYQEFQKRINKLEAERRSIVGASKSEIAAINKLENAANSLLEKRKGLLEQIEDMKRQSDRSGMVKEQSELDRINDRYDELIQNITDYNKKVEEFNKKNPKNQVQQVGQVDIQALNAARNRELDNTILKQDAEKFKKHLEEQMEVFTKYEEAKKEVGIAKARELFGEQIKNHETYLQLLVEETEKLRPKIEGGIANVGEVEKFKAIINLITEHNKVKNAEQIEDEKQKFLALLDASATYAQQKAEINRRYDELEATLRKNSTILEFDERKKLLDQARQDELNNLTLQMARASALYRQLNQDILLFTRERLKEEVKLLKAKLKAETGLSPQQRSDIQGTINQYEGLLDETNEVAQEFGKVSDVLSGISGSFSSLGGALEDTNPELAKVFNTLGDIANIGGQAAGAVASFASGDIIGGIQKTIGVLTSLFNLGKKAKERRKKEQEELDAFLLDQFKGELEINKLYRERAQEQVRLNKLRIQGLEDERRLLLQQRQQVADNYNDVYKQIQGLTAKIRKDNGRGFTTMSLFGQSYEDLQKLFLSGQLEGKAKELFQILEQLKQEGADIDKLLEENQQEARELFTGTTADSISDAIIDGFKEGKRGAQDFAGNFEDLMRQAMIQSLKFKYLEGPIKEFFEEFAAASESDGQLTSGEIAELKNVFNNIIGTASQQFEELQKIAGLNINSLGSGTNSLTGAIKGITEQQAELLAGQFGGLRLTAIDILAVSRQQLTVLNGIQINTATTVVRLQTIIDKMVYYYETRGVKMY